MVRYTGTTCMPFGPYRGTHLQNVPAAYLMKLFNEGTEHPGINQYVKDNLAALIQEAKVAVKQEKR